MYYLEYKNVPKNTMCVINNIEIYTYMIVWDSPMPLVWWFKANFLKSLFILEYWFKWEKEKYFAHEKYLCWKIFQEIR